MDTEERETMKIYIDESGSINNHMPNNKYFVIALIKVNNKDSLKRAYKRFVSSNFEELQELDKGKVHPETGEVIKEGGRMFHNGKFMELKGTQFDKTMKQKFVDFFSRKQTFEVFYIKIANEKLTDQFCQNKARVFNYTLRIAIEFFIHKGYWSDAVYSLQLDERNEKTEAKYFLENYLNTELSMNRTTEGRFEVSYFDSSDNKLIQIADVFANLFYSQLQTGSYDDEFKKLKEAGIIKYIFDFPI